MINNVRIICRRSYVAQRVTFRSSCALRSDSTDGRYSQDAQGTDGEHHKLTHVRQPRTTFVNPAYGASLDGTGEKFQDRVAPWWNETEKEMVLCAFDGKRPGKETLLLALA
jgi:hypothetical protein